MNASQITAQLKDYKAPRWDDFPDVDLYMDQVIPLLTKYLAPLYFDSDKPCITPSMINNYVKTSIVKRPLKKRYKPYHLAYLYVVMVLKQCFTLQEISALIAIYSSLNNQKDTERHFNAFARIFESLLHEVMETGNASQTFYEDPTKEQTLMIDVIRTAVCRIYAAHYVCVFLEKSSGK